MGHIGESARNLPPGNSVNHTGSIVLYFTSSCFLDPVEKSHEVKGELH